MKAQVTTYKNNQFGSEWQDLEKDLDFKDFDDLAKFMKECEEIECDYKYEMEGDYPYDFLFITVTETFCDGSCQEYFHAYRLI